MKISVTSRSFSSHPVLRKTILEYFNDVQFNDTGKTLQGEDLFLHLQNCQGAVVALESIDQDLLSRLPDLKIISKYGVGVNNLDLNALKKQGVDLGHTPGVNKRSVAELTLFFMLGLIRESFQKMKEVHLGIWNQKSGQNLSGKTIGLFGLGNIGKDLVKLLQPLEVSILAHDIDIDKNFCVQYSIQNASKKEILAQSDIISIHLPYDHSTHHYITQKELELVKRGSLLINTSRGNIVNEDDLFHHLKMNQGLAAAGLDVLANEPPSPENPLLSLNNLYITPHMGGSSQESILAMGMSAIEKLVAYFSKTKTDNSTNIQCQ